MTTPPPPIPIALPIGLLAGTVADYTGYYYTGGCIFQASHYFNSAYTNGSKCQGIHLARAAAAPEATGPRYNIYAFTTGFLSYQPGFQLVLRLPRELVATRVAQYNTGVIYGRLRPSGPQLRHVVYDFDSDPGDQVRAYIRNLLNQTAHPMRQRSRLPNPNGTGTITLAQHLQANAANLDAVLQSFMAGETELFIQAGDVLGNFAATPFELRFYDSCGTTNPTLQHTYVPTPLGRPINPAYFLYQVRHARNDAHVDMRTPLAAAPTGRNQIHPLEYLLSREVLQAASVNLDLALDVTAQTPPKPLLTTIPVRNAAGTIIADEGLAISTLGTMWHQSRNARSPFNSAAPVEWRYYGGLAAETVRADYGKFRTRVRAGRANLLPANGVGFDHNWVPDATQATRVRNYWERHGALYNAVARAFQIPCELLVVISCQESGVWFDATVASTREMNVIRMEPLSASGPTVDQISSVAADRAMLNNYLTLTGGYGGGGRNAYIPVPWSGGTAITTTNTLTWANLAHLIATYPAHVKVSPGMMQSLVASADGDMDWLKAMYGSTCISQLTATVSGVQLRADDPPAALDSLFSSWFGVTVDAAGQNTTVAANINQTLSRMKRAFHNIIAGAAHIKHNYNIPSGRGGNRITDLDLPTITSAYNDGANAATAASATSTDTVKWKKLFALVYYNEHYTQDAPKHFNAVIDYFNGTPNPRPAVRFWVEGR